MINTTECLTKQCAEKIYLEHSNDVYKIVLFLTKSKVIAEDITQETFIQVFNKYHKYDLSKPLKPWVNKIAINLTRNYFRRNKLLGLIGQQEQVSKDLIEDVFFKDLKKAELWREINKLSQKCREIIILHYYLDMKLNEVAEVFIIPIGTCKSRLNAALTALKKNIKNDIKSNIIQGGEYNGAL